MSTQDEDGLHVTIIIESGGTRQVLSGTGRGITFGIPRYGPPSCEIEFMESITVTKEDA